MGFKAFLSHPLTVSVGGTVGSTAVIAAFAALKDIKPFTQALVQPVALPLWLVAAVSTMAVFSVVTVWLRLRTSRRPKMIPYVPDENAASVVAAIRFVDQIIEEDELVSHLVKVAPAHVGLQDIRIAIESLQQAGWIRTQSTTFGYGYVLMPVALAYCRAHDIKPGKRPAPPPGMSYVD
jgi:hypothetical protein